MNPCLKTNRMLSAVLAFAVIIGFCFFTPLHAQSYTQETDGVLFTLTKGKMKLKACTPSIIRVRWTPAAAFSAHQSIMAVDTFATPAAFTVTTTTTVVTMATSKMKAEVTLATGAVRFTDLAGNQLIAENPDTGKISSVSTADNTGYTVRMAFNLTTSEGVYGGGHYDNDNTMNRNTAGHVFRTTPANRDKPIPFIISTNQWGILWDNQSDTYWKFLGSSARTLSISSEVADQIDYYLVYGQELDSIISGYRIITGSAPMFPKQAYGYWFSKCQYNNQTDLLADASKFRTNNIPVDVIVQDWLWWDDNVSGTATSSGIRNGYWNSMKWDPNRYTDPAGTVKSVHDNHMLYAISVWPSLGENTTAYTDFKGRGWTWPLYLNFGYSYMYDAYRPEAGTLLWNYLNTGVGGTGGIFNKGIDIWWFDGSEPEIGNGQGDNQTDLKGAISSQAGNNYIGSYDRTIGGYSLAHSRNIYTNQRAFSSSKRVCILTRSVFAGQQHYGAITWVGDAQSAWTQLQREPAWGMNFCAAGVPYWTTDIGAFYSSAWNNNWTTTFPTNAEFRALYTRWFQLGAFLPIFRTHGNEISERQMWNFQSYSDNTYNSQLKFDQLRYRLLPYFYALAWKVTKEGYTLMRTLPFDFRTDVGSRNIGSQFMCGPAFLVNPITTYNATSRSVYLPAGPTWTDFWTGASSAGGNTITATADITSMPLYVRSGSIVPMGPNIQYATQKQADTIELRVYSGADGSFTLYEDEGNNYNYETGAFATIPLTYNNASKTVTIGSRSGSFAGMLQSRVFNIVMVASGHGVGVTATSNPECIIQYTGSMVTGCPVGITGPEAGETIQPKIPVKFFKTANDQIIAGPPYAGKPFSVAVYDLKGKLLTIKKVRKDIVSLRKDLGIPKGVFIVKIKALEQ